MLLAIGAGIGWIPVVGLLGALLGLIGLIFVFVGRRGFGPVHHRFVVWAAILFLVAVVGTVVVSSVTAWLLYEAIAGTIRSGAGFPILDLEYLFAGSAVFGIVGVFSRLLLAYALADPPTRTVLWVATGLDVAIVGSIALLPISLLVPVSNGTWANGGYTSTYYLLEVVGALPGLLFAWAFYHVRERLKGPPVGPGF